MYCCNNQFYCAPLIFFILIPKFWHLFLHQKSHQVHISSKSETCRFSGPYSTLELRGKLILKCTKTIHVKWATKYVLRIKQNLSYRAINVSGVIFCPSTIQQLKHIQSQTNESLKTFLKNIQKYHRSYWLIINARLTKIYWGSTRESMPQGDFKNVNVKN